MCRILATLLIATPLLLLSESVDGRVEGFEMISRADVLDGKAFGDAGAYEKVIGKVHLKVNPDDPHNRLIVDIDKAARDEKGEVAFSADVYILRPKEAARASGAVLIEIPNRGGKGMLRVIQNAKGAVDPTTEEEFGDGFNSSPPGSSPSGPGPTRTAPAGSFLMRRGVTLIWLGWQWDVRDEPGLMRLYAPTAGDPEHPIAGLVRADFVPNERMAEHPLGHLINGQIGGTECACSDPDDPANVLTVRDAPMALRRMIPRGEWQFAGAAGAKTEAAPELRMIRLKGGFEPGKIYEVVYRARDPVIAGLGFAVVRDFASYLKQAGNEAAPAQRVYAMGISQSGRFLRHFLLEGFNADEAGKRAIDGMFIHVAGAGIGSFNHRFAQPSRDAQPTTALFYPTDLFPFADTPQREPETGQTAGLLDRAKAASVLPKIFYTNTSYEYWSRAASLIHTSPDGKRDLPLLDNVRIYLLAGLQHFSGPFPPVHDKTGVLLGQNLPNPNPVMYFWRALFGAMDDWVRDDTAPPASRYPKLADKTLVRATTVRHSEGSPFDSTKSLRAGSAGSKNPSMQAKGNATGFLNFARDHGGLEFPHIPGIRVPKRVHQAMRLDFGPQWKKRVITKQPPGVGKAFPVFVPQVDKDGNDLGGVRLPQLEVPLATYTGWNLRDPKSGMPDERVSFIGSYFRFPRDEKERQESKDSRISINERYRSREDYLKRFSAAADKLINDRYLLREDEAALVQRGREEWDYATAPQQSAAQ